MSASVFFRVLLIITIETRKKNYKGTQDNNSDPSTKIYEFLLSIRFCFLPFYSITGPYFGKISEGNQVR